MISVCHLTSVHGDHDDRIFFKMCRSAATAGCRTYQVAPGIKDSEEDGVSLRALRIPAWRPLRATIGAWRAYRAALRTGASIVHFHDPELIWAGFFLKRRGRRVVFDMHELVGSQVLDKTWLGPLWFRRMITRAYEAMERRAVERFDAIVLAESGYARELLPKYPGHRDRFHIIRNLPVLAIIDRDKTIPDRTGPFTVIYVGGLSAIRGIRELIDAVGRVEGVRLHLLGWWENDDFRKSCEALPGYANTRYLGSVRMDEVYAPMRAADLGALLMYPLKNHTTSRPIKIYEYMACGRPMLLSGFPEWTEAFGSSAWFVDPHDVDAIAGAIAFARDHAGERADRGLNGRRAVEEGLSWEKEAGRLIELYRELAGTGPQRADV